MFHSRWGVRAYDYWWGYTKAQIELMAFDVPTVVYKKKKDKKGLTQAECEDLMAKWNERQARKKAEGKEKLSLDEFLKVKVEG